MTKNKILLTLIIILFLAASCRKGFLDTAPTNKVDDSNVFTTVSNQKTIINGIYRYLYSRFSEQNTPGQGGIMLMIDFLGEDIGQLRPLWYTSFGSWQGHRNDRSYYTSYAYRLYYRVIGNANQVIDNIDKAIGTDEEKKMIKAEALALRAWAYSYLVQFFAKRYDAAAKPNGQPGVPLIITASDQNKPRATVEEIYDQINKDLDNAIALFSDGAAEPVNKSHISLLVAKGIKARVALTMQDYATAADYAKQVVNAGKFRLMTMAEYTAGFNNINLSEWMWGAILQQDQGDTFGSFFGQISYDGNTTYVRAAPKIINASLYEQISNTDIRKKMWEPKPTTQNFPLPSNSFVRVPYMSRKFSIRERPTIGDVPYMRSAEMYLIQAEANARITGKEAEARQALFTLAQKRDSAYVMSTASGQALIDEIMIQRRVELWAEGFRFLDLKRLNLPMDRRVVPNYNITTVNGTEFVAAGDNMWQFLIPESEMQGNTELKGQQNP